MKRRQFLGLSAASTALFSVGLASPGHSTPNPMMIVVVLTDISSQTPLDPLISSVKALVANGISVTCCLSLPGEQAEENHFVQIGLALKTLGAGVEFALQLPKYGALSPYFQSRAAYDAQARLFGLLSTNDAPLTLATLLCDDANGLIEPTGGRASGFRNVLVRPNLPAKVRSETWSNGVVRFFGGQIIQFGGELGLPSSQSATENLQLYYLSVNGLSGVAEDQLATWLTGFSGELLERQMAGQVALISVSDLQLRDDYDFQRRVTIVLDVPENSPIAALENAQAFQEQLTSAGLDSCIKDSAGIVWVQKNPATELKSVTVDPKAASGLYLTTSKPLHFGYGVEFADYRSAPFGIDGSKILHVPTAELPKLQLNQSPTNQIAGALDVALILSPDQIDTPMGRSNAITSILALSGDGITVFSDIYTFAETLFPAGFITQRHQLTVVARTNNLLLPPHIRNDTARAALVDDAKRAWLYFEKFTNRITGLCPSTVDARSSGDILAAVTMWDVGSNINALVAATEIGLIDEKQLMRSVKLILPNILGRDTKGRNLPPGWIKTDRVRSGDRNFDGCDAGRLLSALNNLRQRFAANKELDAIVAAWDLDKIIIDREVNSVVDGTLESTYASHCGHYAAVSFRRWGFDVASPYETFANQPPADGEMQLLETASKIGAFGAEPLVLEAIELGMSPEGAFMADVLFNAQKEEFESTGRLVCVSETPIDHAPWFIYEGLQVGSGLRDWRLNGGNQPESSLSNESEQDSMAFVTKAAYLWAAYKPGEHSDRLIAFAREHAAGSLGFASNVNLKSQTADAEYTDINTNAIILQSIAYMLRDKSAVSEVTTIAAP